MNQLPSPGLPATLSHRMGEGLGVRAPLIGSWFQSMCERKTRLSMNRMKPASDSHLDSAACLKLGSFSSTA